MGIAREKLKELEKLPPRSDEEIAMNKDLEANAARTVGDYDLAISLNPNSGANYNARGLAHHKKGEYRPAIFDFTEAIRLDATNPYFYLHRAQSYVAKRANDEAVSDLRKALELKSNLDEARTLLTKLGANVP